MTTINRLTVDQHELNHFDFQQIYVDDIFYKDVAFVGIPIGFVNLKHEWILWTNKQNQLRKTKITKVKKPHAIWKLQNDIFNLHSQYNNVYMTDFVNHDTVERKRDCSTYPQSFKGTFSYSEKEANNFIVQLNVEIHAINDKFAHTERTANCEKAIAQLQQLIIDKKHEKTQLDYSVIQIEELLIPLEQQLETLMESLKELPQIFLTK